MDEIIIPVCSPEYARHWQLAGQPENLASCHLLHDRKAWSTDSGDDEWKLWAQHYGVDISSAQAQFDQAEQAVAQA